jgi:hypothetical protein
MKQQYRIRNWSEYNASLKQRGSLTFWVSEEILEQWLETEKTGQRGASRTYSDRAIEGMATLKALYRCVTRQIEDDIEQVSADGAYDTRICHEQIQQRGAKAVIPPRKGAKIWVYGNTKAQRHQRDEHLRQIRRRGRKGWKDDAGVQA